MDGPVGNAFVRQHAVDQEHDLCADVANGFSREVGTAIENPEFSVPSSLSPFSKSTALNVTVLPRGIAESSVVHDSLRSKQRYAVPQAHCRGSYCRQRSVRSSLTSAVKPGMKRTSCMTQPTSPSGPVVMIRVVPWPGTGVTTQLLGSILEAIRLGFLGRKLLQPVWYVVVYLGRHQGGLLPDIVYEPELILGDSNAAELLSSC